MTSANSAPAVKLGDELTVSAIGFGAMALTPVYGEVDDTESLATLNRTLDLGVTFIDTANIYGNGNNEKLIAKLLADRRDEVTLATKFGIQGNPADRAAGQIGVRGDAAYVRQSIDESLQRLQTDVVDLYYMHRRDLSVPIEETVGAMAELVAAGKVRHLGLSEVTADELRAAVAVHPIAAVQSEWSIWSRDVERNVVPAAAELGVGFVPYSPLGRGFLTGTISSVADLVADGLPSQDAAVRRECPRCQSRSCCAGEVGRRRAGCDTRTGGTGVVALPSRRARGGVGADPGHSARRTGRGESRLADREPDARTTRHARCRRGICVGTSLHRHELGVGRTRVEDPCFSGSSSIDNPERTYWPSASSGRLRWRDMSTSFRDKGLPA